MENCLSFCSFALVELCIQDSKCHDCFFVFFFWLAILVQVPMSSLSVGPNKAKHKYAAFTVNQSNSPHTILSVFISNNVVGGFYVFFPFSIRNAKSFRQSKKKKILVSFNFSGQKSNRLQKEGFVSQPVKTGIFFDKQKILFFLLTQYRVNSDIT